MTVYASLSHFLHYLDVGERLAAQQRPQRVLGRVAVDEHDLGAWGQAAGAAVEFVQQLSHEACSIRLK